MHNIKIQVLNWIAVLLGRRRWLGSLRRPRREKRRCPCCHLIPRWRVRWSSKWHNMPPPLMTCGQRMGMEPALQIPCQNRLTWADAVCRWGRHWPLPIRPCRAKPTLQSSVVAPPLNLEVLVNWFVSQLLDLTILGLEISDSFPQISADVLGISGSLLQIGNDQIAVLDLPVQHLDGLLVQLLPVLGDCVLRSLHLNISPA